MRRIFFAAIAAVVLFMSCTNREVKTNSQPAQTANARFMDNVTQFIPLDSGNKMISSYINSIHGQPQTNDTDIRSWFIDARQLRAYLDSAQNSSSITAIKVTMAHTLEYINTGHQNMYAGYKANALTLIISGVNDSGNYVFYNEFMVIDRSAPCPTNCPPGSAGNNLLTNAN